MTLRYIFHSAFLLETEHFIIIFDYWWDPSHIIDEYLNTTKMVYVFASHFHQDHFSKKIFKWKETIHDITYILSKDILKHRKAAKEDADVWMAKGTTWQDANIKVIATGSNDSGVSWVIEFDEHTTEGIKHRRLFHAGDLCNWYARFLVKVQPEEQVYSEEQGKYINPVAEEKRFLGELKDISRLIHENSTPRPKRERSGEGPFFDIVMFPVDGRIGNGYTLGGRQFIDRFKVGLFVPMHFVISGYESAWRMVPFCQEKDIPFWSIKEEGEIINYSKI